MRLFKKIAIIFLALLVWTGFIAYGFIDGFLLRSITSGNTSQAFIEAAKEKISNAYVGNVAMALIEDGAVSNEFFYSVDQSVDRQSVYQVASISKWVSAWGVLRLVQEGKLDLDKPVDSYLTRWHLPENGFDNKKVTIRRLLSHTAGLVDHLGYDGFTPNEKVQTLEESLTKASDTSNKNPGAKVGRVPGSQYIYSGAGYTILQLLIEEVSGQSFQDYMTAAVFSPLGMNHSSFVLSEKPNLKLAQLFDTDKGLAEPVKFTALAAASLYSCTEDLSKFMIASVSNNPVLTPETIIEMTLPEAFINDIGVYGLGLHLYSQGDKDSKIIGHDGSGDAVNTSTRIDLHSKSGIVILERGHHDLASTLADEWIYWKAGIADYVVMHRNIPFLLSLLIIGYLVIIVLSIFIMRRRL